MSEKAFAAVRVEDMPEFFKAARPDLPGNVELKTVPVEFKLDRAKRRFEGWAARYGNVDLGFDRIASGAGSKTLKDRMPQHLIKTFFQHQTGIGMPEHAEEHENGLFMVAKVNNDEEFDKYMALIEQKVLAHQSIGYSAIKVAFEQDEDLGREVREILEYKLYEHSAVYWPMNELAEITAVKSANAILGIKAAGEALQNLQLAHARLASGSLPDRDQRELGCIVAEIMGLSDSMKTNALALEREQPGPAKGTTVTSEPPSAKEFQPVAAALSSLRRRVRAIN